LHAANNSPDTNTKLNAIPVYRFNFSFLHPFLLLSL
jgi:hypothetical protein